ncbi:MAG: sugar ABC transporter permease [Chloroflexi bacterium]|nr:sugar ABC transporter permease [Chloroflexota bacterium]
MSANVTTVSTKPSTRRLSGLTFQRKIVPWLFVLPILLINLVVVIGPSFGAIYYSLTDWSGIGAAEFIGLQNYADILKDPNYGNAFLHNLIWLAFFLTIPIIMALIVSSVLAPIRKGGMFFRAALFVAYILPSVITANIWSNLMHPRQGLGAQLAKIGIQGLDIAWLGRTDTSLLSVAFVDNWHWWGFLMVLFLTAMQSVPPELYDAAKIDGANRWQEFRHVTIPGIRPTLIFMLLMTGIWSFLAFDYVYILTQGGPAGSSDLLSVIVYKYAFTRFQAGYASAIGLTMSFFAGIIISIFIILRKRGWEI